MLELVEHSIFSSFKEWFDHTLLKEGRAFFNITGGTLYSGVDPKLNLTTYSAPYYQWVYDQSISGAYVPTTGTGSFNTPYIDYNHGRTISGAPSGTINYSVKELNIYTTTSSEQELIFEQKYYDRPKPNTRTASGLTPYQIVAPCIFLIPDRLKTDEIQLGGGIVDKTMFFSAIIVSDNEYKRFAVGSIFADKKNTYFPYFDETPLNKIGGLKTGGYNYEHQVARYNSQDRFVFIDNVTYTPIEHDLIVRNHPNLYFGKIYFELCHYKTINRNLI
jgi:hypothetical protein